ncbi:hypothetical protein FRC08_004896 [Ceratobasidium sp. 394]|nr:hypothetical protein FRC08_004896 [Ceratobasidium sp. 394]
MMEEVTSPEAFEHSLDLCRNGILVGPSSGTALLGLYKFFDRTMKEKGTLDHLRNEDGDIPSHAKLFTPKPLTNGHTTTSFKVPRERGKAEFDPSSTIVVLDLRSTDDFSHLRLPNAINFPIGRTRNPYQHPPTMVEQFKFIDSRIGAEAKDDIEFGDEVLGGKVVFMLGYDGHSARLAMSVLKNRGLEAYCVMGGVVEWERVGLAPFGVKN